MEALRAGDLVVFPTETVYGLGSNASDPAAVVWHRIDSSTSGNSPTRFPSGIYVDPADTGHAWVTYSGYNAATPSTPGHVFEVRENGPATGSGIFTNLNVEAGTSALPTPTNNGDLPGLGTAKPRVATNSVYMDASHPSALVLPVVYLDGKQAP